MLLKVILVFKDIKKNLELTEEDLSMVLKKTPQKLVNDIYIIKNINEVLCKSRHSFF